MPCRDHAKEVAIRRPPFRVAPRGYLNPLHPLSGGLFRFAAGRSRLVAFGSAHKVPCGKSKKPAKLLLEVGE